MWSFCLGLRSFLASAWIPHTHFSHFSPPTWAQSQSWGIHSFTAALTEDFCHKIRFLPWGCDCHILKGLSSVCRAQSLAPPVGQIGFCCSEGRDFKFEKLGKCFLSLTPSPQTVTSPLRTLTLLDFVGQEEASPPWHRELDWFAPKVLSGMSIPFRARWGEFPWLWKRD